MNRLRPAFVWTLILLSLKFIALSYVLTYKMIHCWALPWVDSNYGLNVKYLIMTRKFFILYGKFAQRQPQLYKTKETIKRHLAQEPNLEYVEFDNKIDAEEQFKKKILQH